MRPTNDGNTIVLSLERYQELLAAETKIQLIESARATMPDYSLNNLIGAMFPAPKESADA